LVLAAGGWSALWASGLSLLPAGFVWVSAAVFFLGLALIPFTSAPTIVRLRATVAGAALLRPRAGQDERRRREAVGERQPRPGGIVSHP
jgi:hypothetical protein